MTFRTSFTKIVSAVCFVIFFTSCVHAAGIGVNPVKLDVSIQNNEHVQKNITISNPENIELDFKVYTENEFDNVMTISDPEFSLGPYDEKQVTITFTPGADKEGNFSTKIFVVALESGGSHNLGSGVKIPTQITIQKTTTPYYTDPKIIVLITSGLLILFLGMILLMKKKKKEEKG